MVNDDDNNNSSSLWPRATKFIRLEGDVEGTGLDYNNENTFSGHFYAFVLTAVAAKCALIETFFTVKTEISLRKQQTIKMR